MVWEKFGPCNARQVASRGLDVWATVQQGTARNGKGQEGTGSNSRRKGEMGVIDKDPSYGASLKMLGVLINREWRHGGGGIWMKAQWSTVAERCWQPRRRSATDRLLVNGMENAWCGLVRK